MRSVLRQVSAPAHVSREERATQPLHDLRFSALVGPTAWARLPAAVRARFGKHLGPGRSVTYAGIIIESRRNLAGHILAQACRLIGAPLPLTDDLGVPAVVSVTEDGMSGGQFWSRQYGRHRGFPQVIHSSKRFAGPTGLEEYLGLGFGIALKAVADEAALRFLSDHYFLKLGRLRLRLPRWLSPGALTIGHIDQGHVEGGSDEFLFDLSLRHPLFGEVIHQVGRFRERRPRLD